MCILAHLHISAYLHTCILAYFHIPDSGDQSILEKSTGDGKERLDKTDDSLPSKINNIQKDNAQSLTDHRNDVDDKLAKHKRNLQVEHESIGSEIQILNQYSEEVETL